MIIMIMKFKRPTFTTVKQNEWILKCDSGQPSFSYFSTKTHYSKEPSQWDGSFEKIS